MWIQPVLPASAAISTTSLCAPATKEPGCPAAELGPTWLACIGHVWAVASAWQSARSGDWVQVSELRTIGSGRDGGVCNLRRFVLSEDSLFDYRIACGHECRLGGVLREGVADHM